MVADGLVPNRRQAISNHLRSDYNVTLHEGQYATNLQGYWYQFIVV